MFFPDQYVSPIPVRGFLTSRVLFWTFTSCLLAGSAIGLCHWVPDGSSAASIPNPFVIEITGENKNWFASYPDSPDRHQKKKKLTAAREIHAPADVKLVFVLKSTDFVYTFAIPQYGAKEIAVPGLEFKLELPSKSATELDLVGEQLCGEPHAAVSRRIVVEPRHRFLQWQLNQRL